MTVFVLTFDFLCSLCAHFVLTLYYACIAIIVNICVIVHHIYMSAESYSFMYLAT
jgi:hypothetical protein